MIDRTITPKRGYPLMVSRSDSGGVIPTTPLNYHVSGTAMQWMRQAMIRTQDLLDKWSRMSEFDGFIAAQVHDELLFDFPIHPDNGKKIVAIARRMEKCGEGIGIPTPVSIERHDESWAEGVKIAF